MNDSPAVEQAMQDFKKKMRQRKAIDRTFIEVFLANTEMDKTVPILAKRGRGRPRTRTDEELATRYRNYQRDYKRKQREAKKAGK